jgi:FtsH-binding integral membrane protein
MKYSKLLVSAALTLLIISMASAQQNQDAGPLGGLCCCAGQMGMLIAPFAFIFGAFGLWAVFIILYLLCIIYGLYSCLTKNDWPNPNDKIAWVLVILFIPLIGTILFVIYNRKKPKK